MTLVLPQVSGADGFLELFVVLLKSITGIGRAFHCTNSSAGCSGTDYFLQILTVLMFVGAVIGIFLLIRRKAS